jgi:uncharacterized delta-60 repeat protein
MKTKQTSAVLTLTALMALAFVSAPLASTAEAVDEKIAFTSDRTGNQEVYVIDPDGTDVTPLTANPASDREPSFSGDGTRIAFRTDRDTFNDDIYVMNADGSNPTRLTDSPGVDFAPAFSRDGSRIAFASNRDGNVEIYVMNADGSNETRLTNNAAVDFQPGFSPDGTRVAFTSQRNGRDEIYVMNVDGSNQTRLTSNAGGNSDPAFSPDGTRIAFVSSRFGTGSEIFIMNTDGSNQTRLTNNSSSDGEPVFSPDGTRIAFSSFRDGNSEIYAMNADGSGQTRLTVTGIGSTDTSPSWGGPLVVPVPTPTPSPTPLPIGACGLDSTFDSDGRTTTAFGASAVVQDIAIQADGKLVAVGSVFIGGGRFALARYNTDGSLDDGSAADSAPGDSFGTAGKVMTQFSGEAGDGRAVVIQPDGKIVVTGSSGLEMAVVRYNANGSVDTAFGNNGISLVGSSAISVGDAVVLQGDGKIVVAGSIETAADNNFLLARFNANGSRDDGTGNDSTPGDSFGTGGIVTTDFNGASDFARALIIDGNGKFVAAESPASAMATSSLRSRATIQTGPLTALSATGAR